MLAVVGDLGGTGGRRGELVRLSCVYFFLAFINLRVKLALTPAWMDGRLERNHGLLTAFQYVNHEQSRWLQFGFPELLHRVLGLEIVDAYVLQRWLFVFLAFVAFHAYLRRWFDPRGCFLGVALLAALMPLSYFDHLQESAPLLLLTFLLGLWAIREGRDGWYAAILALGALNNETVLILPAVYLFVHFEGFDARHLSKLWTRTVGTALPAFAVTLAIRWTTRDRPYLGGGQLGNAFGRNVEGVVAGLGTSPLDWWNTPYLFPLLLYGALWVFAFQGFSGKPRFLRRASLVVPIFVGIHVAVAVLYEVRQLLPLAFLLIPLALFTLVPPGARRA